LSVIALWLHRLRAQPHLKCLIVVPYWVSMFWWPLLLKLLDTKAPVIIINPYEGLFLSSQGVYMPPPKWPLICCVLSGKSWRSTKYHLNIWEHIKIFLRLPDIIRRSSYFGDFAK
jgi:hypothetical protein